MKIRHIIENLSQNKEFGWKFHVPNGFWDNLVEIEEILKIPHTATIDSQKVGYGLTDFYISWLRLQKGLERFQNTRLNLAEKLLARINEKVPSLFKTPLMLCAVYLDPRINFKLSSAQKREAVSSLVGIYERITTANSANQTQKVNDTLDEIIAESQTQLGEQRDTATTALLESFVKYETEKSDIRNSKTQFWRENGFKYPLIEKLAQVIHTVGANQCCVEQSFSAFSYIRSKYRMSMDPNNMSNLLMIRLNKDVFYKIRQNYIQNILNS